MVLPDMCRITCSCSRGEEKHTAAAALEFQPDEGQPPECPAHGRLGVANLDDEQPLGSQMRARLAQDYPHGIEPVTPRRERDARLVPILRRES